MQALTAPTSVDLIMLAAAAVISVVYSAFLAAWLSPRVRPEIPRVHWLPVGLVSAAITAGLGFLAGDVRLYAVLAGFVPILVLSTVIDARTKRIPNAYVVQAIALSIVFGIWLATSPGTPAGWGTALAWSAAMSGLTFVAFFMLNVFSGGGFGMGDVKLGAIMAFGLSVIVTSRWTSHEIATATAPLLLVLVVVAWVTLSFIAGGVFVLIRGIARNRTGFPFGPCLVIAWFVAVGLTPLVSSVAAQLV